MKLFVCIKPQIICADVIYDDDTGQPLRPSTFTIGELDEVALQAALDLCHQVGGAVTVLSVAGSEAEACMQHCLERGAKRAIHVDYLSRNTTSDTLTAAQQIANIIQIECPDIVFCGSQSEDLGSGFFPYAISRVIGYKLVTQASEFELVGGRAVIIRKLERGWRERYELELPVVIAVDYDIAEPRHVSLLGHGHRQSVHLAVERHTPVDVHSNAGRTTEVDETELVLPRPRRRPFVRTKARGSIRDRLRSKRSTAKSAQAVRLTGAPEDIGKQLLHVIRGWIKGASDTS